MEREITVVVDLKAKDVARFQLSVLLKQWYIWFLLLPFAGGAIAVVRGISEGDLASVPEPAWYIVLLFPLVIVSSVFSTRRARKNRFVMETKTFRFSEERVLVESESIRQSFRWTDFVRYSRSAKDIYLFLNRATAHILPYDAIDPPDRALLLLLIQSKVKKRKAIGCIGFVVIGLFLFLVLVGALQYYLSRSTGN